MNAIIALIPEDSIQLKSPYPVTVIGPNIEIRIPPPIKIRTHIIDKKPNKAKLTSLHPLKLQRQLQENLKRERV